MIVFAGHGHCHRLGHRLSDYRIIQRIVGCLALHSAKYTHLVTPLYRTTLNPENTRGGDMVCKTAPICPTMPNQLQFKHRHPFYAPLKMCFFKSTKRTLTINHLIITDHLSLLLIHDIFGWTLPLK